MNQLFVDYMEKVAGRSYHRTIKNLVRKKRFAEANALIDRLGKEGKLRITPQGTQIGQLGSGLEGVGTLVYGAKDNPRISVRKAYDRASPIYSKTVLSEKHNAWRRAQAAGDKRIAKLHSKKIRRGKGGTPYVITQYVHGKPNSDSKVFYKKPIQNPVEQRTGSVALKRRHGKPTKLRLSKASLKEKATQLKRRAVDFTQPRHLAADTSNNPGNVLQTARGPKIIDFLPTSSKRLQAIANETGPELSHLRKLKKKTLPSGKKASDVLAKTNREASAQYNAMFGTKFDPGTRLEVNRQHGGFLQRLMRGPPRGKKRFGVDKNRVLGGLGANRPQK